MSDKSNSTSCNIQCDLDKIGINHFTFEKARDELFEVDPDKTPYSHYIINSEYEIIKLPNPNNFVEWQKKCVCDFENNNNTHSKDCLERFKRHMERND